MRYKYIFFIGVMVVLSLVYTWYEANRPRPVDWTETYSPKDKIPYGTYIVYQSLDRLFPSAEVNLSRLPLMEEIQQLEDSDGTVYMIIGRSFNPDPVEVEYLLDWVGKGNYLFVAANRIADTLLDRLQLEVEYTWDKAESHFNLPGLGGKVYSFESGSYFVGEQLPGEVLGYRRDKKEVDFVRVDYESGVLFFNLNPEAYTNYRVLDSTGGDYYYKALSCLPVDTKSVIWDGYFVLNDGRTPLEVILRYPALHLALYLLLAGGLLYLFFKVKREQRPIPVILPPKNRMLEFVTTVSALYFKQKDHYSVAIQYIAFFMDEVRSSYLIHNDIMDKQFADLLSERSGVEKVRTEQLVELIRKVQESKRLDEHELKVLMKGIDEQLRQTFRMKKIRN